MKKILSLILAALMLLCLCACASGSGGSTAGTEVQADAVFQAGFGKADISPRDDGVPMNGFSLSTERLSTGLQSYLFSLAVAVRDSEGNTAVMVSLDHTSLSVLMANEVRDWAEKELGIPRENIILSAIHQHSCPDPSVSGFETSSRYKERMLQGMKDSIAAAVEDLAPAEMYINKVTTEAMSFVRQYWTKAGTIAGSNYGDFSSGIDRHESDADTEMRLLKFVRQDKEDIVVVNFQTHPHMGTSGSSTQVHSDWPGVMRDIVTEKLGVNCLYFSGAGGNLNSTSRIEEENISVDYKDHGKRAAQYVVGAEDSYTKVNTGKVVSKEITVAYEADHSMDHLYEQAKVVADARSRSTDEATALLKNYPELHTIFHATAIVDKYKADKTRELTISAVAFGDVAFTSHPYEMFDTNGMELRNGTVGNENYAAEDQLENPYAMTFIATMANASMGYIPSQLGYTNGGYSTDITKFAPGTGEQVVGDMLQILNELHP